MEIVKNLRSKLYETAVTAAVALADTTNVPEDEAIVNLVCLERIDCPDMVTLMPVATLAEEKPDTTIAA